MATADLVVIAESTWDIIAYLDLRQLFTWKNKHWATISTRGASGAGKVPAAAVKEGATVLRLLQNDAANAAWVAKLPPMPQARHRQITPPPQDKVLNDWIRRVGAAEVLKAVTHQ